MLRPSTRLVPSVVPSPCEVTLLTASDSFDSWSTAIFLEVISIEVAISYAFANVNSFSTRRRRCIFSSRIPHTILSLSIISRVSLYSQCSAKFLSAATKSATDSPSLRKRLLNLNFCTISEGFGAKWSWISFTSSWYDFSFGLAGAKRSHISL